MLPGAGKRASIVVVVVAVFLVAFATAPRPAQAEENEKPTLLGFATQDWRTDLPDFEAEAGKFPAFRQVFWNFDLDWSVGWLPPFLDDHHAWGIVPWQVAHAPDLDAFNAGEFDQDVQDMVDFWATWMADDVTKRLVFAPFPEANLASHAWSGDPAGYKAAFERIHDAFREAGLGPDRVRFAFVMNGISSAGYSYDQFYPGDELVDILAFNKHNRNIVLGLDDPWRDYEATFGMHIEEMAATVSPAKPIFINQTASVDDELGRRTQWLDDMFAGLKAHPQVIGAIYFNRLKEEKGEWYDFRVLIDGVLDPAFNAGHQTWSDPSETAWIFDGRMDDWVADRATQLPDAAPEPGPADFLDVPPGHIFATSIEWLAEEGITKGCNPPANDLFCPDVALSRAQMAAFLVRALDLPAASKDHFGDDTGLELEDDINRLAESGITSGCNPPANSNYCPSAKLTRAQMAALLVRALGYSNTGTENWFVDDDGSIFEDDIARLRVAGVTLGCNPPTNDRFCPNGLVTRGQMAAFLYRALVA